MSYGWIVLIVIVVFLLVYIIGVYNSLVSLRNKVDDQLSQIDVELKKRFDLIPNLVETVKGYAKHEKDTLKTIVEARNAYASANNIQGQLEADGELTKAINKLFALAESYPDLKTNENFIHLQTELASIEEKIGFARSFYNDSVLMLNNKIQMFPSNIIAKLFGFNKHEYFQTNNEERENVKVKF